MAKTYSEKLKDPRWQKMRLRVMERDNFTCRDCFSKEETLHVHHAFYEKGAQPWEYEDRYLITLCAGCHEKVEAQRLSVLKAMASPHISRHMALFAQIFDSTGVSLEFLSWALSEISRMALNLNAIAEYPEFYEEHLDEIRDAISEGVSSLYRFLFCIEEQSRKYTSPSPQQNDPRNPIPTEAG
jgi:hypothetical protein